MHRISGPDAFHAAGARSPRTIARWPESARTPNHFAEVLVSSTARFRAASYLTDMAAQYKDFKLATREVVQWKSTDGATIEGILIKPAGLRSRAQISAVGGDSRRPDRRGYAGARRADRYYPVERSPPRAR